MVALSDPLDRALGGRTVTAFAKAFGFETVADLLHHYPRRYFKRGELTLLSTLRPDEYVTVLARVKSVRSTPFRNKRTGRRSDRTEVVVTDGADDLLLTFFNQPYLARQAPVARLGLFSGQVGTFRGRLQLVHPDMELLPDLADEDVVDSRVSQFADRLIPVYPAAKSLPSPAIDRAVQAVLPQLDVVPDPIPDDIRDRHNLVTLDQALRDLHQPRTTGDATRARARLAFDEALIIQLALARRRHRAGALRTPARGQVTGGLLDEFDAALPYELTSGQRQVGGRVADGLSGSVPMHVLLQGDVGTGKTLVALRAMLQVVDAGGQAVLLAPTEVLAQQHYASITALLGPLAEGGLLGGAEHATRVALLTGSMNTAARKRALLDIATGEAGIVIGTHALLQDTVIYHDLGLIVVDEQHRFGVEQRSSLLERIPGQRPHLLVMTATPIPRSVAMTVFGDLDVVALTERPSGAPRITSHVVSESAHPAHLDRAWERVVEEVGQGRQVFVVCTRIADDDKVDADTGDPDAGLDGPTPHAVEVLAAELAAGPLRDVRVGVMHGRMAAEDKEATMSRFAAGPADPDDGIDVLVSTTVIEVGVDVPAAGMMVIMDADRFGVSQLHQLRGRVGRDGREALCLFVTSTQPGEPAHDRLSQVAGTLDGFALARLDLEQRREGDVLGAVQSGRRSSLRLLSVLRDEDVIDAARREASDLVANDPQLQRHPLLAATVTALEEQSQVDYLDKT